MTPEVSLVIPVCNEAESLPALIAEIDAALAPIPRSFEILFVDDGSRDGSWAIISAHSKVDPKYRGLRFRRNFGKAAALAAGFKASLGKIVFTLDADLQDDPAEIPHFLAAIESGLDVVSGWKKIRHDPWHKVFPSRVFNAMVSRVTGVPLHDHNCGFKAYRAEALKEVRLYGELHRFVPVLAAARGFKVGELVIHHRPRKFGASHYGFRRFIKGFLDLVTVRFLTAFNRRPQHILGTLGLLVFALGMLGFLGTGLAALTGAWQSLLLYLFLLTFSGCAVVTGSMIFMAGLLAEVIVDADPDHSDQYSIVDSSP